MQQILCVAFSSKREWDQQNVIITGSTDGVVRVGSFVVLSLLQLPSKKFLVSFKMWSMEYVQIPIEEKEKKASVEAKASKSQKEDTNLIKQISEECSGGIDKSPSESSLSEACDSVKETSKRFEAEKEDCSENDETPSLRDDDEPPIPPIRKKHSISAAKSLHEFREEDPELVAEHKNGESIFISEEIFREILMV